MYRFLLLSVLFYHCNAQYNWEYDACHKFKFEHPCRCLGGSQKGQLRQLVCNADNVRELKEALDTVRGQSFYTIEINDVQLIPYQVGLFQGIKTSSLIFARINVDHSFRLDKEIDLTDTVQSLVLKSVNGLDSVDWDLVFGGFWLLSKLTVEDSPFRNVPMSANAVGAHGSYLSTFTVTRSGVQCVDDLSMSTFSDVRVIDLSNNKLGQIRRETLPICKRETPKGESCLKLEFLNLRNNRLTFVPDNLLTDFPELNKVLLGGNYLSTLSHSLVMDVPKPKFTLLIDVYDNPIRCNCESLRWILEEENNIRVTGTCQGFPDYSLSEVLITKERCKIFKN